MANVVLITKGSFGDVIPFISLGEALQKRGNRVVLLSQSFYEQVADRVGLEFDCWDTISQYWSFIDDGALLDTPAGIPEFSDKHIFPTFEAEWRLLQKYCVQRDTVLVSRHMGSFAADFVSERYGIPHVSVFTAVSQVESLPLLAEFYRAAMAPKINSIRRSKDLSPIEDWNAWVVSHRYFLGCWPPWYAQMQSCWPANFLNIGFLSSDLAETGPIPPVVDIMVNPVLITGGTAVWRHAAEFYNKAMGACGSLGRDAILVCRDAKAVPEKLDQRTVHFHNLPFASLLPRVSALIHHGGASITARALASGVPQLVLPFGGDRPDTASRLMDLGVAITLARPLWTVENIANALNRVLNSPDIAHASLAARSRVISQDSSLESACLLLESLGWDC